MADGARLVSKSEYARHRDVSPAMVTHWTKAGRIVIVEGKVDLDKSDAALAASMDQARGGKGGRSDRSHPAAKRAGDGGPPEQARGGASPGGSLPSGPTFSQVQTARVGFAAQREKLRYEQEAGKLVEVDKVEQAIADALAPILSQLDTLSVRAAPRLVGLAEIRRIQDILDDEVRAIKQETADTLRSMIAGALVRRQ
jgi:hypothetical protein